MASTYPQPPRFSSIAHVRAVHDAISNLRHYEFQYTFGPLGGAGSRLGVPQPTDQDLRRGALAARMEMYAIERNMPHSERKGWEFSYGPEVEEEVPMSCATRLLEATMPRKDLRPMIIGLAGHRVVEACGGKFTTNPHVAGGAPAVRGSPRQ